MDLISLSVKKEQGKQMVFVLITLDQMDKEFAVVKKILLLIIDNSESHPTTHLV